MIKDCTYGLAVLIFSVPFLLTDFQSNIVTRVLASGRVAKVLSEKIMLLINREGWCNPMVNV